MTRQDWPDPLSWTPEQAQSLHSRIQQAIAEASPGGRTTAALEGVVDRHGPVQIGHPAASPRCAACQDRCGDPELYPCAETRGIADAMGVLARRAGP